MDDLTPYFTAWRTMHAGTREMVDALVRPESRADPGLAEALGRWPGAWYWADRDRTRLTLVRAFEPDRPRWLLHAGLFLLTLVCALGAGAILAGSMAPRAQAGGLLAMLLGAGQYLVDVVLGDWQVILTGWSFAVPLLLILLVHELGHYLAARRYALDATPPYFLPVPPTLSPIGSLGAFIRLRSPVLDRRQLMDVGAAGPLAGFVVALLFLVWGYTFSERIAIVLGSAPSYVTLAGHPVFLGDSILTRALRDWLVPGTAAVHLSPPAFAGWVGMFVTALNLLPLSQLDGGHVLYGLLGPRQKVVGLAAVVGLLYLAQQTPMWYLWVVLALVVGGGRWAHPAVLVPDQAIPASRSWMGLACVVVFVLTFMPHPFG